jgi:hypothetical protein
LFRFYRVKCFFFGFFIFAGGYASAEQGVQFYEKAEIIQRINWEKEDDVLKYEFIIEKKEGDTFTQVFDGSTEETELEISLPPGEYRYRVLVYDLLGRQRPAPEWSRLIVLPALQPEITSVNPPFIDISSLNTTITLGGKNLVQDAEVYFTPAEGGGESLADFLLQSTPLSKDNYHVDNSETIARLELNDIPFEKGFYDIIIKNPGGLFTVWRNYRITDGKEDVFESESDAKFEITTGAAYTMLIPISGSFNEFTGNKASPTGVSARFGMNTKNKPYGIFGAELAVFWHYLVSGADSPVMSGHFADIQLNILYQIRILNQRAAVSARIGGGLSYFFDLRFSEAFANEFIVNERSLIPVGSLSLSFSWFLTRHLFLDICAEYTRIFSTDEHQPAYIRPALCLGFRL